MLRLKANTGGGLYPRRAFAIAAALLILFLGTLAVSPELHELIHKDANEAGHECAITVFAHGQVDSVSVDIAVIAPPVHCTTISFITISVFSASVENLPFGRGPPASVSSQA